MLYQGNTFSNKKLLDENTNLTINDISGNEKEKLSNDCEIEKHKNVNMYSGVPETVFPMNSCEFMRIPMNSYEFTVFRNGKDSH